MSTLTILAADTAQFVTAHRDGPDGPFWPIFPLLWLLIVGGIVTTFLLAGRRRRAFAGPHAGEAKLAERFAAGEIDEQEYRQRLSVLKTKTK